MYIDASAIETSINSLETRHVDFITFTYRRFDVIELLLQTGAHLNSTTCEIASKLYQCVRQRLN